MSSRTTVRLSVTTRGKAAGTQCLDVSNMLGPGGCHLLQGTLRELNEPAGSLAGVAAGFPWRIADPRGERYSLDVAEGLPQGVESLTVHLGLRGSLAEVRHEARFSVTQTQSGTQAAAPPPAMQQQVQRLVNRNVNRLLALTVANQLRERVTQKIGQTTRQTVRNAVSMRMRNMNTIQTVARVRAGVGK